MVVLRGNIANRKIKSGWTYSLLGGLSGSCVTRIFCSIISIGSTSWWKLVPSLCGKCLWRRDIYSIFSFEKYHQTFFKLPAGFSKEEKIQES